MALPGCGEGLAGVSCGEDVAIGNKSCWITCKLLYVISYGDCRPVFRQNLAAPFVVVTEQDGVTKPRPFETKGKAPNPAAQIDMAKGGAHWTAYQWL